MSEDEMLKCLIAFVLGFLVGRMVRGNGLSVGGQFPCFGNPMGCAPARGKNCRIVVDKCGNRQMVCN